MANKPNPWAMSEATASEAMLREFEGRPGWQLRLYLVRYGDQVFRQRLLDGNALACEIADVIGVSMTGLMTGGKRASCLGCEQYFEVREVQPAAFVVWLPGEEGSDSHDIAMCSGVCDACAKQSDAKLLEVAAALAGRMFGGMTVLEKGELS